MVCSLCGDDNGPFMPLLPDGQACIRISECQRRQKQEVECAVCGHWHAPWDKVHGYSLCGDCPDGQCHDPRRELDEEAT